MRLRELAFRWTDGARGRVLLEAPQHAVHILDGRPPRALRDALSALFYGSEHFPAGADPGLLQAGLVFEAEDTAHKALIDLSTGRRVLTAGGRPIADTPDAVDHRLALLLDLPDLATWRALSLADVDLSPTSLTISAGLHRALLAHARAPGLPVEPELQGSRRALPWSDPRVIGGVAAGAVATLVGSLASGSGRLVALLAPVAYGLGAVRALRAVDSAPAAPAGAAQLARARHLQLLEEHLRAIEAACGARDPDTVEAVLRGEAPPHAAHRARVSAALGRAPAEATVERLRPCLPSSIGAASLAFTLAAALDAGSEFPLLWVADGALASPEVDWAALHAALGRRTLLTFWSDAPPDEARPAPLLPL